MDTLIVYFMIYSASDFLVHILNLCSITYVGPR